ncbi:hypothetical protein AcV5_003053 [Taiwanofungus camphoratus]|nr:hypothetical protein AcV5_003053 [Antrodia cinnamomea]
MWRMNCDPLLLLPRVESSSQTRHNSSPHCPEQCRILPLAARPADKHFTTADVQIWRAAKKNTKRGTFRFFSPSFSFALLASVGGRNVLDVLPTAAGTMAIATPGRIWQKCLCIFV